MSFHRYAAVVAAGTALAAFGVQACGGDDNVNGDGGNDATTNDVAADTTGNDVVASDGGCPVYTGNSTFCKAAVANCQACNGPVSACERTNFTTYCEGLTPYLSQAALNAFQTCATICDNDAASACRNADLADAALTAAQLKLANDYCSVCSDSGACVGQLEQGLSLVQFGDPLANAIDSKCAPDAASKCAAFPGCAFATLTATVPPNPCADASAD